MSPTNADILSHIAIHTDKDDRVDLELSEDGKTATIVYDDERQDFDVSGIDRNRNAALVAADIWDIAEPILHRVSRAVSLRRHEE